MSLLEQTEDYNRLFCEHSSSPASNVAGIGNASTASYLPTASVIIATSNATRSPSNMDHCNHELSADRFAKRIFDTDLASLAPFSRRAVRENSGKLTDYVVKGMSKQYENLDAAFDLDTLRNLLSSYASYDRSLARHRMLALLDFTLSDGRLVMFLEPYPSATLATLLKERSSLAEHLRGLPEGEAVAIWASVTVAVTFLHLPAINLSHMGIHPGTVLLYNIGGSGVHKWLVKLTEPMHSILATANARHENRNWCRFYPGVLEYLAPETIKQLIEPAQPSCLSSDRKNADIWNWEFSGTSRNHVCNHVWVYLKC